MMKIKGKNRNDQLKRIINETERMTHFHPVSNCAMICRLYCRGGLCWRCVEHLFNFCSVLRMFRPGWTSGCEMLNEWTGDYFFYLIFLCMSELWLLGYDYFFKGQNLTISVQVKGSCFVIKLIRDPELGLGSKISGWVRELHVIFSHCLLIKSSVISLENHNDNIPWSRVCKQ